MATAGRIRRVQGSCAFSARLDTQSHGLMDVYNAWRPVLKTAKEQRLTSYTCTLAIPRTGMYMNTRARFSASSAQAGFHGQVTSTLGFARSFTQFALRVQKAFLSCASMMKRPRACHIPQKTKCTERSQCRSAAQMARASMLILPTPICSRMRIRRRP